MLAKENSGDGTGHYETFPISDGSYYGFTSGFNDGSGQTYPGSGNWVTWHNADTHLQFYFELAE